MNLPPRYLYLAFESKKLVQIGTDDVKIPHIIGLVEQSTWQYTGSYQKVAKYICFGLLLLVSFGSCLCFFLTVVRSISLPPTVLVNYHVS